MTTFRPISKIVLNGERMPTSKIIKLDQFYVKFDIKECVDCGVCRICPLERERGRKVSNLTKFYETTILELSRNNTNIAIAKKNISNIISQVHHRGIGQIKISAKPVSNFSHFKKSDFKTQMLIRQARLKLARIMLSYEREKKNLKQLVENSTICV